MDAQIEISNMQPADAIPLEDRSLPASETLKEQQADMAEKDSAPVFVPVFVP